MLADQSCSACSRLAPNVDDLAPFSAYLGRSDRIDRSSGPQAVSLTPLADMEGGYRSSEPVSDRGALSFRRRSCSGRSSIATLT